MSRDVQVLNWTIKLRTLLIVTAVFLAGLIALGVVLATSGESQSDREENFLNSLRDDGIEGSDAQLLSVGYDLCIMLDPYSALMRQAEVGGSIDDWQTAIDKLCED